MTKSAYLTFSAIGICDCIRASMPEPFLLPLEDSRVNEAVELDACVGIVEDDAPQDTAIDCPIGSKYPVAELTDYGGMHSLTRLQEAMRDLIGVDQVATDPDQHLADSALASGNPTGQADSKH